VLPLVRVVVMLLSGVFCAVAMVVAIWEGRR
jgi:hypothetical protein